MDIDMVSFWFVVLRPAKQTAKHDKHVACQVLFVYYKLLIPSDLYYLNSRAPYPAAENLQVVWQNLPGACGWGAIFAAMRAAVPW
jgi:hypothetical protein